MARDNVKQPAKPLDKPTHAGGVIDAGIKGHHTIVFFVMLIEVHAEAPRHALDELIPRCQLKAAEMHGSVMVGNAENRANFGKIHTLTLDLLAQFVIRNLAMRFGFHHPSLDDRYPVAESQFRITAEP